LLNSVISRRLAMNVLAILGNAAEEPSRQQVLVALEEVWGRIQASMIALMLAYVSATDMAAADVSAEILATDERLTPKL
jgi:hypothetical protein